MSGSRPSFRTTAARRLAEDRRALSPALEDFLSDTRRISVRLLPVHLVDLNATRQTAAEDAAVLEPLLVSVRELGVLEPILVRPLDGGRYEVVAGERRLRASRQAGLEAIPAVVREMDDATAASLVAARTEPDEPAAPDEVVEPSVGRRNGRHPNAPRADEARIHTAETPQVLENRRPVEQVRGRRGPNGTYMPPAVVTRREPRVISGPGIPGPGNAASAPQPRPEDEPAERVAERAVSGDDGARRPRFRFAPFPFLRRERSHSEDHR